MCVYKRELTLEDTIPMMQSKDYKERFRGEYWQLQIRIWKLKGIIEKYKVEEKFKDGLPFKPNTPIDVLETQLFHMQYYLNTLKSRARMEDVEL